uniref:Protein E4 n=1 Tax=Human papillomavirus 58 TaxID=10598 RepID=B6ZB02_HPV58|nr:E4 protein [human papillomavirus 58]ACK37721.1 E4 protein [human papillomavirus 58]
MYVLHLYLVIKYPLLKLLTQRPPRPPTTKVHRGQSDDDSIYQTPETTPSTPQSTQTAPWTVDHEEEDYTVQLTVHTKGGTCVVLKLHLSCI